MSLLRIKLASTMYNVCAAGVCIQMGQHTIRDEKYLATWITSLES